MKNKTDNWNEFVSYINKILDESSKRCATKD